jgi:hypothetical protein
MTDRIHRPDRLGDALRGLGIGHPPHRPPRVPAGRSEDQERAPRADLDTRLTALEQDLREVRTRINALFFAVLTAALGDLAGRVVLG